MSKNVVIVAALRTPIGKLLGTLSTQPAHELGRAVIEALLKEAGVAPDDVSEVILGQVLTANAGMNPPRQAALHAGLPHTTPAWNVNQVCGSGLKAVVLGMQQIERGDSRVVIAGGQESMSQAPHCAHLRAGKKMGPVTLQDSMLHEGLTDAFASCHMGITAENIAERFDVSRDEQDTFALDSQHKCKAAMERGDFEDEIVPITVVQKRQETTMKVDEAPRPETSGEDLRKLRPAFKEDGTVTAGNSSGINDGASAVVLMSEEDARGRGLTPLARIVSWAQAGVDPDIMGVGPVPASRRALELAKWSVDELDHVELNEAFAAQSIYVNREMGWKPEVVNPRGGAIALGHPIGASGARILTTMLHAMKQRGSRKGIATLCIGGGMGIAMCVERV